MDAAAPPIVVIAARQPETLQDWERRLLDKARVLRQSQKGAKLIVEFQGPAMLLYTARPDGKVE